MTALTKPIHVGLVNGHPIRFFRRPTDRPEMPWHVFDDLMRALELPRNFRRHYLQSVQRDFKRDLHSLATPEGVVLIAPHWMAQGLIGASIDTDKHTASIELEYAEAGGEALTALTRHMPAEVMLEYTMAAFRNTFATGAAST